MCQFGSRLEWGCIIARWHYWSRILACCILNKSKTKLLEENEAFFIQDKYSHLAVCLHMIQPHQVELDQSWTVLAHFHTPQSFSREHTHTTVHQIYGDQLQCPKKCEYCLCDYLFQNIATQPLFSQIGGSSCFYMIDTKIFRDCALQRSSMPHPLNDYELSKN